MRALCLGASGLAPACRCRRVCAGPQARATLLLSWGCTELDVVEVRGHRPLALLCLLRLLRLLRGRLFRPQVRGRRPRSLGTGVPGRRRLHWLAIAVGLLLVLPAVRVLLVWLRHSHCLLRVWL